MSLLIIIWAERVTGTVKVESSEPLLIEWRVRFTTVPLKAMSDVSMNYIQGVPKNMGIQ